MTVLLLRRLVVPTSLIGSALLFTACAPSTESRSERGGSQVLSLVETLGGLDTTGYARALEGRDFIFPEDHGPHSDFRTEWWYVTGNLSSEDGRDFGFQFTIFRNSLAPVAPGGPSNWATNQAYMGHFALTDIEGGDFRAFELFARGGGGLAGARNEPLRVWIEDWKLESQGGETGPVFPLRLTADGDGVDLKLDLASGKSRVLQGELGLSQKGPEPGNASYYYSHSRMPASGQLVLDGDSLALTGLAWLDREWSTSALSEGQVGWDWFALQLDDGWEMMVYQLRLDDGTADPLSDGVLIDPDGQRIPLEWGSEILVEPTDTWRSPVDGATYPSGWRVRVPSRGWDLTVEPALRDQELRVAFRYWEGSVRAAGVGEGGRSTKGRGYVELTGYADPGR
jgi:predicted secreted hydrolase